MAIIQGGAGASGQLAITTPLGAALVNPRPIDVGSTGGHYRYSSQTGTVAAALAANAVIFAFRWGDSTLLAVLTSLKVRMQGNAAFTNAAANLGLHAIIGRTYSASHTGGTAATMTGNNNKLRTSFQTSKIATNGDIRLATTAALGGGTVTTDSQAFCAGGPGRPNVANAAGGTEYLLSTQPGTIDWQPARDGEHPIVLAQNEGILVRNSIVWPVAGTAEISVEIGWSEVSAY